MDDKDRNDPGITELSAESSWTFGGDSDGVYFFGSDRESTILSEFGWNLRPDAAEGSGVEAGSFPELDRIGVEAEEGPDLAVSDHRSLPGSTTTITASTQCGGGLAVQGGTVGDASTSNQSVSSSSSEDLPEKSTASGGDKPAPETA